jgi:hypothetical protein
LNGDVDEYIVGGQKTPVDDLHFNALQLDRATILRNLINKDIFWLLLNMIRVWSINL